MNNLTTGQVAKILQVSARTVTKWFDNGMIKGFVLPDSKDRRIPEANVFKFAKEHNIPVKANLDDIFIQIETLTDLERTVLIRRLS